MNEVFISNDDFVNLFKTLSSLKEVCTDAQIVNGVIRQRSDDSNVYIEIDMRDVLNDQATFSISNLKNKIDLFRMFLGSEVSLEIEDDSYLFMDDYSKIKIINPSEEFLNNTFITEEELRRNYQENSENLMFEYNLSMRIIERIKMVTQKFGVGAVQFLFENSNGKIKVQTQGRDQLATFAENIALSVEAEPSFMNVSNIPFTFEYDIDMTIKSFLDEENNIIKNNFVSSLGDIIITFFSRATLLTV